MTQLVLDTNVVRHLGAGELEASVLRSLPRPTFSVHLSDAAATELIAALCAERLSWEHWMRARAALQGTLSSTEPILLGNQQGLQLAGLPVLRKRSRQELDAERLRLSAAWQLLCAATSLEALFRVQVSVPPEGTISISADLVADVLAEEHRDWGVSVDRFRDGVLSEAPRAREAIPARGDSIEAINGCVEAFRSSVDADFNGPGAPPSLRMDAFLRVCALFFLWRLRRKETYDPTKRANDVFDLDLLKYLSFPAVVCTADNRLLTAVEITGSWQRSWIVRPSELADPAVLGRLTELAWPDGTRAA